MTGDSTGWQIASWEKKAWCVLKLQSRSRIHGLALKNAGSAFVEVLVARISPSKDVESLDPIKSEDELQSTLRAQFEVLLTPSSFMTATESIKNENLTRTRYFDQSKLNQTSSKEEWDLIKVICAQPFNKNINFGLSSLFLYKPSDQDIEKEEKSKEKEMTFGIFQMKDDDEEESGDRGGSLFSRLRSERTARSPPPGTGTQGAAVSSTKSSTSSSTPPKKPRLTSASKSKPSSKTRKPKKLPFNEILKGVVFALSGFVNPERGDLRSKALQMGAKYRPDWTPDCTHLV